MQVMHIGQQQALVGQIVQRRQLHSPQGGLAQQFQMACDDSRQTSYPSAAPRLGQKRCKVDERPSVSPRPLGSQQVGPQQVDEKRMANDGLSYTRQEFLLFFGAEAGARRWEEATVDGTSVNFASQISGGPASSQPPTVAPAVTCSPQLVAPMIVGGDLKPRTPLMRKGARSEYRPPSAMIALPSVGNANRMNALGAQAAMHDAPPLSPTCHAGAGSWCSSLSMPPMPPTQVAVGDGWR